MFFDFRYDFLWLMTFDCLSTFSDFSASIRMYKPKAKMVILFRSRVTTLGEAYIKSLICSFFVRGTMNERSKKGQKQ